jgi:hypothetical protein
LAVFVVDALHLIKTEDILKLVFLLEEQLKLQNISSGEISLDMVDRFGFLTLSTPHQFGLQSTSIFKKYLVCRPSFYEMISDQSLSRERCLKNVRSFNSWTIGLHKGDDAKVVQKTGYTSSMDRREPNSKG